MNASAAEALAVSALPALNPNHPNQRSSGAEQRERHVVRQERRRRIVAALADADRSDERGDAGVHVDDRAAGEVERAHVREPAAAPDPVRDRTIDDERPTD